MPEEEQEDQVLGRRRASVGSVDWYGPGHMLSKTHTHTHTQTAEKSVHKRQASNASSDL